MDKTEEKVEYTSGANDQKDEPDKRVKLKVKNLKLMSAKYQAAGSDIMQATNIKSNFYQFKNLPVAFRLALKSSNAKFLSFVLRHKVSHKNKSILLCCFGVAAAKKAGEGKVVAEISAIDHNNKLYMIDGKSVFPDLSEGKLSLVDIPPFESNSSFSNFKDLGASIRKMASTVGWSKGKVVRVEDNVTCSSGFGACFAG